MAYCTSQDRALPNSCASVINSDVITIMIVEIEAIVGSIWSRSALNMFRVRVELSPPEMNIATTTSSKEDRNDSSAAVITAERICGSVIVKKTHQRVAPRLRAAISWFMS